MEIITLDYPESFSSVIEKLVSIWEPCEPLSDFSLQLDHHLLCQALKTAFYSKTGRYPSKNKIIYKKFIETTLTNIGFHDQDTLKSVLMEFKWKPSHPLLKEANQSALDPEPSGKVKPIPIIARAIILLRIASAASQNLFFAAGINWTDIGFWWRSIGTDFGLWDPNNEPLYTSDLWSDIELSCELLEAWCTQQSIDDNNNFYNARTTRAVELWHLQQFQRIGLWSLSL